MAQQRVELSAKIAGTHRSDALLCAQETREIEQSKSPFDIYILCSPADLSFSRAARAKTFHARINVDASSCACVLCALNERITRVICRGFPGFPENELLCFPQTML